jgi:hypothetical protein
MTNNGKPCCAWCGAELIESKWNLEVNVLYCTASGCERFRFPQMKRYLVEDDPDGGPLVVSKWILAGRRASS